MKGICVFPDGLFWCGPCCSEMEFLPRLHEALKDLPVSYMYLAIDILHQYKSVAYVVNERGIRETRTVSLPAYWLFSVTYRFNKQPKKK